MKLKIKTCSSLCSLEEFEINGIEADQDDFVEQYDRNPENSDDYCCGNMQASPILPKENVLKKYNITIEEYKEIAEKVAKELSFGSCGWCS